MYGMAVINVLIGTNNPGKFSDAEFVAKEFPDIRLYAPKDLGIIDDADETGNTYTENAHIKRDFYLGKLKDLGLIDYFVVTDDSGIEIDALGGEPGIHSRRWQDGKTAMTDQEVIDYVLKRMDGVPAEQRTAAFAGIVALGYPARKISLDIPYRLQGTLLVSADIDLDFHEGYPFRALFYLPQYGMMLSRISELPRESRPEGFMSHRELGMKAAFEKILELSS